MKPHQQVFDAILSLKAIGEHDKARQLSDAAGLQPDAYDAIGVAEDEPAPKQRYHWQKLRKLMMGE